MEKIKFSAMCQKLFLKPLIGKEDDILYFVMPQPVSAALALSGFKSKQGLKGRVVFLATEEAEYLQSLKKEEAIQKLKLISQAELVIVADLSLKSLVEQAFNLMDTKVALSLKPSSIFTDLSLYIEGKLNTVEIIHGQLLDIFGVGVLLTGESGIGKSEIALDLITRGHLLVADDAVAIRREGNTLIGCSPSITRHLMEIRGIGIIDVKAMFGAGAIKIEQEIDLAINLEPFSELKDYSKSKDFNINEVSIPLIDLPLRQGRNLSVLIEVAVRNLRLKAMGFDAAKELNIRLQNSNQERK